MIEEALCQTRIEREQLDCLAIGLGPGSYAGIRSAIALAQGWQLAREVKLLGISSAECLAAQAAADGLVGSVTVIIYAQRGEFYLSTFEVSPETKREVQPLRLASLREVEECQRAGNLLIGPEATKWFPSGKIMFPRACMLGQLAAQRMDFVPGEKLEPIYLRETAFVKAPPPRVLPE
jgi:tRNA threonylcarbamoyladenosine biosynthesis protein TsaB